MASTRERIALASLLAVYLGFALACFDPTLSLGGDDARYLGLADALASGRGYRDLLRPGEPLHGLYPPLYPALLAPIRAAGGGLAACKALSVVAGAVALLFGYALARRRLGVAGATAFGAALALNPTLLEHSHQALSEACFFAFLLASLYFAERPNTWPVAATSRRAARATSRSRSRSASAPISRAAPASPCWSRCRWHGGSKDGAARRSPLRQPARSRVAAWTLYSASVPQAGGPGYFDVLFLVDPYAPERGRLGIGGVLARAAGNALAYVRDALPALLAGRSGFAALRVAAALALLGLALVGGARGLRRPRALECFAACYAGLLLVWSGSWTNARYLLPLLPALRAARARSRRGARACASPVAPRRRRCAARAARVSRGRASRHPQPRVPRAARARGRSRLLSRPLARLLRAGALVRRASAARRRGRVPQALPLLLPLGPARGGVSVPRRRGGAARLPRRVGASHVVVDAVARETSRYLTPALRSLPQRFALLQRIQSDGSSATLFAIRRSGAGAAGEGVR